MGDGGDSERIAPVIPLFGASGRLRPVDPVDDTANAERIVPRRTGDHGLWRSTWDDRDGADAVSSPSDGHPARGASPHTAPRLRVVQGAGDHGRDTDAAEPRREIDEPQREDDESLRVAAEEMLVRRLRSKALSVAEARGLLRAFEVQGQRLGEAQIGDVIDDYCGRGYLDDATLAWHLVTSGVERKGQGRVALSRALAQRGIERETIEHALAELPDDDAERALEFARSKARSMADLEHDTALRRLVGQLARRGYGGPVAMSAAKTALAEVSPRRPGSGVRFVDSD